VAGFLFVNLLVFPVIALDGHVAFLSATILLATGFWSSLETR